MKLKYLAHASFLITSDSGLKIITDPYEVGGGIKYARISESADAVTVSHGHRDHNSVSGVKGSPVVVQSSGATEVKGIQFMGIQTYHDQSQGKQRGNNIVFCFTVDGIRLCHLGDLGHELSQRQVTDIGTVNVLLVPVGGTYALDAGMATSVWKALNPNVTVPMHYKTPKVDFPIAGVDDFLGGKNGVRKVDGSEIMLDAQRLPRSEIAVLEPFLG
ncbi:MAG: MBL fold metallo-hydrolase [Chloroflexi bacterium]|nr:MBL fold metallo-hydrolase [Chloroflexota bacterium]